MRPWLALWCFAGPASSRSSTPGATRAHDRSVCGSQETLPSFWPGKEHLSATALGPFASKDCLASCGPPVEMGPPAVVCSALRLTIAASKEANPSRGLFSHSTSGLGPCHVDYCYTENPSGLSELSSSTVAGLACHAAQVSGLDFICVGKRLAPCPRRLKILVSLTARRLTGIA